MFSKVKKVMYYILAVLAIIAIIVPYILIYFYLKKSGQTITIYPSFKISKIENTTEIDKNALESGLRIANEILEKAKEN